MPKYLQYCLNIEKKSSQWKSFYRSRDNHFEDKMKDYKILNDLRKINKLSFKKEITFQAFRNGFFGDINIIFASLPSVPGVPEIRNRLPSDPGEVIALTSLYGYV